MSKTILGVFDNRADAESAINSLETKGFNPKDISIVMKDTAEGEKLAKNTGADVAGGAVSGATTGAVVGGLAGLLVGLGAIAIPGIGAVLVGGPLAAALGLSGAAASTVSGAATGALAGGIIGALVNLGIPEKDAHEYEERIKAGAILVAVPARNEDDSEVKDVLTQFQATNVRTISMN